MSLNVFGGPLARAQQICEILWEYPNNIEDPLSNA